MTLITAMKFNDKEGAIVADEQSSTSSRKYDFAEKTHVLTLDGTFAVYGGSGAADFLHEAAALIEDQAPKAKQKGRLQTVEDAVRFMSNIVTSIKRDFTRSYFESQFGVSEDDLQRGYKITQEGRVEFDPEFKNNAWRTFNSDRGIQALLNNGFLVLTCRSDHTLDIYTVTTGLNKPVHCARPYACIGSGEDMADGELSSFLDGKPRAERKNLDPVEGLAELLYATDKASRKNIGVGGVPHIILVNDGEVTTPSEENSKLAGEMVLAYRAGYIPRAFTMKSINALMNKGADFRDFSQQMMKRAGKKREDLDLLLRGYKV